MFHATPPIAAKSAIYHFQFAKIACISGPLDRYQIEQHLSLTTNRTSLFNLILFCLRVRHSGEIGKLLFQDCETRLYLENGAIRAARSSQIYNETQAGN